MAKPKKIKSSWRAAICYNARSVALLLRETLEEMKFEFTREKSEKNFTRMLVIMPMPQFAYVFQFKISKPSEFIINTYDVRPTHSGEVHYIELQKLNEENIKDARLVLRHLVGKLPRKPWKIFMAERLQYGLLAPEYIQAKSAWYSMGIS
jgi:hypothetical protein